MTKRKRGIRGAVQRAKQGSGISWPRILGAALAAVTMTLISARLTSVFGTLMLTGVISIGSALVAEFYRILINMTAEGTKKVVAPIINELDLPLATEPGGPEGAEPENPASEDTESEDTGSGDAEANDAEAAAAEVAERAEEEQEKVATSSHRLSQFTLLALIFGVVSLATIGVSYAVARAQGGDIYQTTTVQRPIEQLDDEEKQALVDLAVQMSQQGLPNLDQLSSQIDTLAQQNQSLQDTIDQLRSQQESDADQIAQLQQRITELNQRLDSIESQSEAPETTPDESTE